jgi:AraC-like DNA-binding protein
MKKQQFRARVLKVVPEVKQALDNKNGASSVSELAETFKVSRNSIQNAFKQQTGDGIRKYKLKQRMEIAKQMLEDGEDIKVIAFSLNYSHSRNFSTAFKKYFGSAPTDIAVSCANADIFVRSQIN